MTTSASARNELDFVPGTTSFQFHGYTAVLPGISIGNLGQMTLDVILNTYLRKEPNNVRLIGPVDSDYLEAFFADNPFEEAPTKASHKALSSPCTSADVYEISTGEERLLVIQQRAHIIEGYENSYYSELFQWLESVGVTHLLVISGASAAHRNDEQLQGPPYRYIHFPVETQKSESKMVERLTTGSIPHLEPAAVSDAAARALLDQFQGDSSDTLPSGSANVVSDDAVIQTFKTFADMGGMGYSARICRQALDTSSISCTVLLRFINEGDNTLDAFAFANKAAMLLGFLSSPLSADDDIQHILKTWQAPSSWHGLFGGSLDPSMYT
eukprot:gb/GECG01013742.1/.p1 GENE.gb/GECG01013742.1/~~gb/GECG01013742.1/.p1  ORF type:complete len:327 (+),score=33.67 gb/GECG01013742.1/:1-981(+)